MLSGIKNLIMLGMRILLMSMIRLGRDFLGGERWFVCNFISEPQ
jgi:hypothetical protein